MMRISGATHPLPHMRLWLAQVQVYVYLYTSLVVAGSTFATVANDQGLILSRDSAVLIGISVSVPPRKCLIVF